MKPKKPLIGIIGGTGQMGQWFKRFFKKQGHKVLIASRTTKLTPAQCAKKADIIIVTVPIHKTVEVIKKVAPLIKKEGLITDLTSVKSAPVKAMLKYAKCEVIGMHPVFGPSVNSLNKQTVVLCPARTKKWLPWLKSILQKNKANIKITTVEKHDKLMSTIQGIIHFSNIVIGNALKELKTDINGSMEYTSPIYKIRMDMIGRILNQDPNLYADIEILNPETKKTIKQFMLSAKKLQKIINKKDRKAFVHYFIQSADFIGDFKKDATEESDYLIEQLVKRKKL